MPSSSRSGLPLRRASDPRTGLYLTLGAALVGPAVALPLAGCGPDDPPAAPEAPVALTGVETVIQQQPDGSYQITDEKTVEGRAGGVTIVHTDASAPGGTRTERLDSPEEFAARLPATPPDSAGLAGGSWGDESQQNDQNAQARPQAGFGLGNVLLMSALFTMWRPPYYAGYNYAPPRRAYANEGVRQRSRSTVGPAVAAARSRGTLATTDRVRATQRAAATRAARPSGGRSGAFSSGGARSGGG